VGALKERRADGTALAGTLDHKQTVVDLAGLGHQLGQVLEAGADGQVLRLVDDGLGAQSPPFF
jgi:F420-0:gamma-glutamyl ligase-like protein